MNKVYNRIFWTIVVMLLLGAILIVRDHVQKYDSTWSFEVIKAA